MELEQWYSFCTLFFYCDAICMRSMESHHLRSFSLNAINNWPTVVQGEENISQLQKKKKSTKKIKFYRENYEQWRKLYNLHVGMSSGVFNSIAIILNSWKLYYYLQNIINLEKNQTNSKKTKLISNGFGRFRFCLIHQNLSKYNFIECYDFLYAYRIDVAISVS